MAGSSEKHSRTLRRPGTFRAFRDPSYRLLWPANFLSHTSRWMQVTLLGWMVLELTDSPLLVSLVGFFAFAPLFFLGLAGGALADSADKRKLLMLTQLISLVAALAMMLQLINGTERFWHGYVTMLFVGVAWALDMPSRRAIVYDLLGREGVSNAVALDSMGISASLMVGPALGGALITLVEVEGGYVAVVAFYVASVVLLSRMSSMGTPQPRRDRRGSASIVDALVVGFRYVVRNQTLLATVLVTVLMNLLMYPFHYIVPVIARDVLGVGPGLMGILQAAVGLGSLMGAVAIASVVNIRYHGRMYLGGSMVSLVALLLFSFSRSYPLSALVLLVLGLGTAGFATMQATLPMLVAKQEMRGRVLGVISLAIGVAPLGALIVGAVANAIGPTEAIRLNATLGLGLLALIARFLPSLVSPVVSDERTESVPNP